MNSCSFSADKVKKCVDIIKENIYEIALMFQIKTSLGRGRALIRFNLVQQRLADTLQLCLSNGRVTSNWYFPTSALLRHQMAAQLISALYELNEVQFDLAPTGYDLDAGWPTFAK